MGDDLMVREYNDVGQRHAICQSQWDNRTKGADSMIPYLDTKQLLTGFTIKEDAPGSIEAVYSTFGVVDRGGDIVEASAIEDGKQVPMTWAHDWSRMIGKGTVTAEPERAIFRGQLFLDTAAGQDAYQTIKSMGDLIEYSWGFRVLDAAFEQQGDNLVRRITKAEQFEVSPVLVGEGLNTGTLSLKHGSRFDTQADTVLAAVADLVNRSRSLADLRMKEGRVLSSANRDRLASIHSALLDAAGGLKGILKDTEPEQQKIIDLDALLTEYMRIEARAHGVAV